MTTNRHMTRIWTHSKCSTFWEEQRSWQYFSLRTTSLLRYAHLVRLGKITANQRLGFVDFLNLARIGCNSTPTLHVTKDRRSRNDHHPLYFRARRIPSFVHSQLDLPLGFPELLGAKCCHCWSYPNSTVLGLLLYLLHKVSRPIILTLYIPY